MRIDAHQHFWHYHPVRDAWITDEMKTIQRDFLPEDLYPHLTSAGLQGCVAVQAGQSENETNFLIQQAAQNTFIKGVVGWVDLAATGVEDRLRHFGRHKVVKGFRHILQGEADRRYMLREDFCSGIAALQSFGFTYDILIHEDQLPFVPEFVGRFPDQPFVIDHLAKPKVKTKEVEAWKKNIYAVAQFENVYCKVSGMTTEADWQGWRTEDFHPYLDAVVEAFGMKRLLFGSDWPVCLLAGTYRQTIGIVENYFAAFSREENESFFGNNAVSFYKL
jgi:L-fuconolactonase